jgi:hypothetical protein
MYGICYLLPGNTVVETRRMVLVKIEPQLTILRSCDMGHGTTTFTYFESRLLDSTREVA